MKDFRAQWLTGGDVDSPISEKAAPARTAPNSHSHTSKRESEPADAKTQAKRSEIALTYAADQRDKRRQKPKPPIAWLRVAEMERIFKDRYGAELPDDDAGRDDLWTALQHLAQGTDAVRRCQRFIKRWAPWMPEQEAEEKMTAAIEKPYRFKADTLAERLGLSMAKRTALGITTIGACE